MCTVVVSTSRWLNIIILCLNSLLKLLFILTTRLSSPICYVSKSVLFFISSFFLSFLHLWFCPHFLSLSLPSFVPPFVHSLSFLEHLLNYFSHSFIRSLNPYLSRHLIFWKFLFPLHSFSLLDNLIKRNPLSLSLSFSHFFS